MLHRLLLPLVLVIAVPAWADPPCRSVEIAIQPSAHLQIAAWIEDDSGKFIDTAYVTRATGALGLGNRPGNAFFKSAYRWPYGRREMVLPIWAHQHNHSYGYVVMGGARGVDPVDDSIGYHESYSSTEPFYCSPSTLAIDATSCASPFVGSKGVYAQGKASLYPPRADLTTFSSLDSQDARTYSAANDVAAVSGATPPGGQLMSPTIHWAVPPSVPNGNYRVRVEVSLENDPNGSNIMAGRTFKDVNAELRPFGYDIFGQPSVVYSVPITLDGTTRIATTNQYEGYSDWDDDGSHGTLHPPDSSISDTPSSGAGRLAHVSDIDGTWQVKVVAGGCQACGTPLPTGPVTATPADTTVTLTFTAPASSGGLAAPRAYQVRYRPVMPLDDNSFTDGTPGDTPPLPAAPGVTQTMKLTGLKAETVYSFGIRSVNACGAVSPGQFASATTQKQKFVVLHGCFIATAAYGSPMEPDVALLRRFRDRALLDIPRGGRSVLGALAVALYYTNSPPMAAAISTDERLRALARRALEPAVALARAWLLTEDARR
jgi:hypothetical protein